MNLQVQVTVTICLVLLVIQPAFNHPINSFKELSYEEAEHERAHAKIRIVERETIKKSPICDCHSKFTKLPAVTIHQVGAQTLGQPQLSGLDIDIDDLPPPQRHADEIGDDIDKEELPLHILNEKYERKLPSLAPRLNPANNRKLAFSQQVDTSDIVVDEAPASLRKLLQNYKKINGEKLLLRRLYEQYGDNLPPLSPQPCQKVSYKQPQIPLTDIDELVARFS